MAGFERRLVLKSEVGRDDVELAAWEFDWNLVEMGEEGAEVYIDIWQTDDEKTEIHYVEDRLIGLNYLTLRGGGVDMEVQRIETALQLWSLDDALESLRVVTGRDEWLVTIYAIALTAPEGEERDDVVDVFREFAADPDPGIRQAVVVATGYRTWPALVEIVEELHRNDPVDHVRKNAGILLEGIRLHGQE
ncbi:HEAT repeat domain-containing protein [Streptomyces triculaminicus]|uniref:HEAT repeat domain-containing protein n=1 Tax=Streptomyces triculaminicus TaxID=2816232 RepID=UPI0037D149A2